MNGLEWFLIYMAGSAAICIIHIGYSNDVTDDKKIDYAMIAVFAGWVILPIGGLLEVGEWLRKIVQKKKL